MSSKPPTIIYTLIARGSKIVLSDYTDYNGNFQQISLMLLNRIKKNKRCQIEYNNYQFYYDDESDITYLCFGENYDTDAAFCYLSDLKKKFLSNYELKKIQASYSYQLKDFSNEIKNLAEAYERDPSSKLDKIKNNLSQSTEILKDNINNLVKRNEKLDIIAQKSHLLLSTSDDFVKNINEIKKKQKMKQLKYIIAIAAALVVVFTVFYFIFRSKAENSAK